MDGTFNEITPEVAIEGQGLSQSKSVEYLRSMGYVLGKTIGSGQFGTIYKAAYGGAEVACKVVDMDKVKTKEEKEKLTEYMSVAMPRELEAVKKLNHPNIVKVYRIFVQEKRKVFIFMELADMTLSQLISDKGGLTEVQARKYFTQLVYAIRYMQSMGHCHRDIKTDNILLKKDNVLLTDFGFARSVFNSRGETIKATTYVGDRTVACPEFFLENVVPYDAFLADNWSLGVTLYVMVQNDFPFDPTLSDQQLLKMQMEKKYLFKRKASEGFVNLVGSMLEPNPKKRANIEMILAHPWVAEGKKSATFDS